MAPGCAVLRGTTRGPLMHALAAARPSPRTAARSAPPQTCLATSAVRFGWNPEKATRNERKPRRLLEKASAALRDTLSVTGADQTTLWASARSMRKAKSKETEELRPEYKRSDFGTLVRGKYAARIAEETNVVVLEPEVARVFPNDKAVNEALRADQDR